MIDIIFLLILLLISFSLGEKTLRILHIKSDIFLETFCFAVGIGLGILAYIVFFLGILSLLYPWMIYLLVATLSFLSIGNIKVIFRNISLGFKDIKKLKNDKFFTILLIVLVLYLSITFFCALAPVTDYDSQIYHLTVLKTYIKHHAIVLIPLQFCSDYPLTVHMLYLLAMLLHSDILASLIHWLTSFMVTITILTFGRKFFSWRVGIISAVIFLSSPVVLFFSPYSTIDNGLTFLAFLALYGFIEWFVYSKEEMLILSAIASGLTAGIKYNGLVYLAILLISLGWILIFIKKERWIKSIKKIVIYGGVSLLILLPWLIKNLLYRGNPVYPFLSNLFSGYPLLQPLSSIFRMETFNIVQYVLFPWYVTIGKFSRWSEFTGPFYLAFVPLLIFVTKSNKVIKYLLIYSLLAVSFFYFFARVSRYILPSLAALAVAVAYVVEKATEIDFRFKKIMPILIIFPLLINLGLIAGLAYIRLPVILGWETCDHYLSRRLITYDVIKYVNEKLERSSKILFFDPRVYYCNKETIDAQIYYITDAKTTEDALARYKKLGLTHILFNSVEIHANYRGVSHLQLVAQHLKLVYEKNKVYLYKIEY